MILIGITLALLGLAVFGAAVLSLSWASASVLVPIAVMLFGFGCVLCGLAAVRNAVIAAANQIASALSKPSDRTAPAPRDLGPLPEVAPTPHPDKRRPTYEELTGKRSAGPT